MAIGLCKGRAALAALALLATATAQEMEFDAGKSSVELPLVMLGNGNLPGLPCIELGFGEGTGLFLLDTGFNAVAVRRGLAADLGLEQRGTHIAASFGGTSKVPLFRGPAVDLRGARFTVPLFYGLDLDHFAQGRGRQLTGILGAWFFARCVLTIDYARGKVVVSDQQTWQPPPDLAPTRLDFRLGQPEIWGTIDDGRPARFMIDTGAETVLLLNAPFVARSHLADAPERLCRSRLMGLGGRADCWFAEVARFAAGPLELADCPVVLMGAVDGFDFGDDSLRAGLIGTGMLHGRAVTFDYARRRLFVAGPPQPAVRPLGITVDYDDGERGTVAEVLGMPDSPAVDLLAGDRIVAIDGAPLPALPADFRAAVTARETVELTVERGGERHVVAWRRIEHLPRVRMAQ